jgi:hypothetical protein
MQAAAESVKNLDDVLFVEFIPGQTYKWLDSNKMGPYDRVPMNGWVYLFSMSIDDYRRQNSVKTDTVTEVHEGRKWLTNLEYRQNMQVLVVQVQPGKYNNKAGWVNIIIYNPKTDTLDTCMKWVE